MKFAQKTRERGKTQVDVEYGSFSKWATRGLLGESAGVRAEPSQSVCGVKAVGSWGSHLHCSLGHRALGNAPHDLPPRAFNDPFSSFPFCHAILSSSSSPTPWIYHLIPSLGLILQLFTQYMTIRKGINTFWWDLGTGNSHVNIRSISSLYVSICKPFDASTAQAISQQELLESLFIQVTEAFPRNRRTWVIFLLFFGSYREAWLAA